VGYDVQLHSEEMYRTQEQRSGDGYSGWIEREHPEFDYIEALQGERTEMYYMPQVSPLPPHLTVESWAADRAVEQLAVNDDRPFFGFVSFIGPHPPFAPPVPFNRMYDPDKMPDPVYGDVESDHADEQIPYMNRIIWADDITDSHARVLKARYYGELSYIDDCLGRILDAVEARQDDDNTVICFFADHGDHMGDHRAWQKESFFDASNHIPFLLSWPENLPADELRDELICLTDLFAIATGAAGQTETRDGADVLGMLVGSVEPRETVIGMYGRPGTAEFKVMVRKDDWKYIFIANGGRVQLFNLEDDPNELINRAGEEAEVLEGLCSLAVAVCEPPEICEALKGSKLQAFPFGERERGRIYQFDKSRGVGGFPEKPEDALKGWNRK
jgi:choline-sulfatase